MCVHIFGGMSLPSCCNFELKQTPTDKAEELHSAAVQTLQRNFYLDYMFTSVESKEIAIKLVIDVIGMCHKKGALNSQNLSATAGKFSQQSQKKDTTRR